MWVIDTDSLNREATAMLGLPLDADLSSPEIFRSIYWSQPPEDLYCVVAVQPYRMNERLTIQQGVFLCANHGLFPFERCLANVLAHASRSNQPSAQWLHKIPVAAEARADVLRHLDRINISSATLFPGLDGFCRSLQLSVQIREADGWPGVSLAADREEWVKGV